MTDPITEFESELAAKSALCDWCRHPSAFNCFCDCHLEAVALIRLAADSGNRTPLREVMKEFGIEDTDE